MLKESNDLVILGVTFDIETLYSEWPHKQFVGSTGCCSKSCYLQPALTPCNTWSSKDTAVYCGGNGQAI